MFELSLTNDLTSAFLFDAETRHGFNKELHRRTHLKTTLVAIEGLSYADDIHDLHDNENVEVILCGRVFYRFGYKTDLSHLNAEKVCIEYQKWGMNFLKQVKGNFVIVIADKKQKRVFVAKDQLGLKPVYYKVIDCRFYVSTNLNDFKGLPHETDNSVILEHLLFSYPIGTSTFIKGVYSLGGGRYLELSVEGIKETDYFNVSMLFPIDEDLIKFDIDYFSELFRKSVVSKSSVSTIPNVTLTGGFDGRTNIAVLMAANIQFFSYSFGKRGGENTEVPINVARELGLSYSPVYLETDYEQQYSKCAKEAIWFSDGISRFERANYIYTMKQIARRSNVNITGLLTEAYQPVHMKKDYISELYYNLVYKGTILDIRSELCKTGLENFVNLSLFTHNDYENVVSRIEVNRKRYVEFNDNKYSWVAYLKDLITLGFPRFYGVQMHIERYFCENLSTYYDIDLLDYLYSTNHLNRFRHAFKKSPVYRINNRRIQSYVINKYYPSLGKIPVDRGYPPSYNLGVSRMMIPFIFFKRERSRKKDRGPKDFDTPRWVQHLFCHLLESNQTMSHDFVKSSQIKDYLSDYCPSKYNSNLTRLIGLSMWLKAEQQNIVDNS